MSTSLTLNEARAMIDRAIEKATELHVNGAFVVVDEGGNVISVSRMDGAPASAIGVSRAKAYLAATCREPTARFAGRMYARHVLFDAYQTILPDKIFPGPGGMPIMKNGKVVGGISTGPGIGPRRRIEGVDPAKLMVNGEPANAEDLIVAYALQIPYTDQHPDMELK